MVTAAARRREEGVAAALGGEDGGEAGVRGVPSEQGRRVLSRRGIADEVRRPAAGDERARRTGPEVVPAARECARRSGRPRSGARSGSPTTPRRRRARRSPSPCSRPRLAGVRRAHPPGSSRVRHEGWWSSKRIRLAPSAVIEARLRPFRGGTHVSASGRSVPRLSQVTQYEPCGPAVAWARVSGPSAQVPPTLVGGVEVRSRVLALPEPRSTRVATSGVCASLSSLTTSACVPSRKASEIRASAPARMVRGCGPSRRAAVPSGSTVSFQSPPTVTRSRVEPGTGCQSSRSVVAVTTAGWSLVPVDGADGVDDVDVLLGTSLEGAGARRSRGRAAAGGAGRARAARPEREDAGQEERGPPRLGDRTSYGRHTPTLCWKCASFARYDLKALRHWTRSMNGSSGWKRCWFHGSK